MDVQVRRLPAGELRLEHAIQGSGSTLREVRTWPDAAVVSDHHAGAILGQDMHRPAVEQIPVLSEDIGFWPFPDHGALRQYEDVLELFHRDLEPHAIARSESPEQARMSLLLVDLPLVVEEQVKAK